MPTYQFRHRITLVVEEKVMRISERDQFLKDNLDYEQVHLSSPSLGDPVALGFKKVDDTFRDILKERKRKNGRMSNIRIN